MPWNEKYKRIVLTGPESTGKSMLAGKLAEFSGGLLVPEYARSYTEQLSRKYTRDDLDHIAETQLKQYRDAVAHNEKPVIFDTFLIITKIWYIVVYGSSPAWIDDEIMNCKIDMYLLCYPDIPWKPDPVRENPGTRRMELYYLYKKELERFGLPFKIIDGSGEKRFNNCIAALNDEI
jgi:nicotinamide riboside kinase